MLLLALVGCEPLGPAQPGPEGPVDAGVPLRAEPSALDFGVVEVESAEDTWEQSFTLTNRTGEALQVEGLTRVWGGDGRFSSAAPPVVELEPGESVEVPVRFTPGTDGAWEAFIAPSSQFELELRGEAAAPVARLIASSAGAEPVWVGCSGALDAALLNDGSRTLRLHTLELSGSADFTLLSELPADLEPGGLVPLRVGFTPQLPGPQSISLTLTSDDPAAPERSLTLDALGVPGSGVTEEHTYSPTVRVDWILAVDSGPAMAAELGAAQADVLTLLEAQDRAEVDWQITVVTGQTDCHATVDPFLYPEVFGTYDATRVAPALAYALNPEGSGTRALLDLALATVERTDPGDCLEGLLRPGAMLHVVLLTNGAESSDTPVAEALADLEARQSGEPGLRVSSVTGQGGACTDGGAAVDAAQATGGATLDLCTQSWEQIWEALAQVPADAAGGTYSWTLAETPVLSTLTLRSGERTLTRWSYDATTNRVSVDGDAEDLAPGDPLSASYLQALACEG